MKESPKPDPSSDGRNTDPGVHRLGRLLRIRNIPSANILSLSAALGGVIALLIGLILVVFIQELRGAGYTVVALGGIFIISSILVSYAAVRSGISGRRGRYGTNTVLMIVLITGLTILVYTVIERNPQRWDVTATGQFSLAPQTLDILASLKQLEPVRATAFFVPGDMNQELYRTPVEDLLREFKHHSGGEFTYRFVDPDRKPTIARQYGVDRYPSVAFEGLNSRYLALAVAPLFQERNFASALLIVTGSERKQIYYLEGMGGPDIKDLENDSHVGFGFANIGLIGDNYQVVAHSLIEKPLIPLTGDNAVAAVMIANPTRDMTNVENAAIQEYLSGGGRLLLLLEPNPPITFARLLANWAVGVEKGTVVDLASTLAGQSQTPLIKREQFNSDQTAESITVSIDQSYFPGSASIASALPLEEMPNYIRHLPIARTTLLSCTNIDSEITDCPGGNYGYRTVAMAVEASSQYNKEPDPKMTKNTKIVIFGDTDFATNFHFYSLNNSDLFLNSMNWLTEDISLSDVRAKPISTRRMVVSTREMQVIRAMSWFILPGTMILLAAAVWWRRR